MDINLELIEASKEGDLALVKKLISKGADINFMDNHDYTALFYALEKEHKEIALFFIESGADLNICCAWDHWTYLIKASYFGYEDIVKILIDKGLDVNAKRANGETALLGASMNGYTKIVRLLPRTALILRQRQREILRH